LNLSPKNEDKVQMIVDGFFQTLAVLWKKQINPIGFT
jgi:hypothetical protein